MNELYHFTVIYCCETPLPMDIKKNLITFDLHTKAQKSKWQGVPFFSRGKVTLFACSQFLQLSEL